MDFLDAALDYAARGWHVFPLKARGKEPATAHGVKDATTDPEQIRAWWSRGQRHNIGIATGAVSGFVVIDTDNEQAEEYVLLQGNVPTLTQSTAHGRHRLYQHPGDKVSNRAALHGVVGLDVRGDGGYIVAAPSVHPSGAVYAWENDNGLAPLPGWVARKPERERQEQPVPQMKRSTNTGDPYAEKTLDAELAELARCQNGTRNATLFKTARRVNEFVLAGRLSESVFAEIETTAQQRGLPEKEITATIASARSGGTPEYAGLPVENRRNGSTSTQRHDTQTDEAQADDGSHGSGDQGVDRPVIDVTNEDIAELVPAAWNALIESEYGPQLYTMGNELYRIVDNKIEPIDRRNMRYLLGNVALFPKDVGTGKNTKIRFVAPPASIVDSMRYGMPDLPAIERIIAIPVVAPQGHIVKIPGYDQQSGYYYKPEIDIDIPGECSDQHVSEAIRLIDDMLVDFPFKKNADYANALALLLLPFVRGAIRGATPLHLIEAAREGTGKGLLNDLFHIIWTNAPAPLSSLADNDEEVRKSLTSALEHMPLSITYDNVRYINSAQLEKAITAQHWSDRVIGTGRIADVPVYTIWIATGNNVSVSGDMPRRVVPIRLVADCEQPALRNDFRHSDIVQWTYDHRVQLIQACLTIIQYGLSSNARVTTPRLGSFTKYCTVMSKILASCGIDTFLENAIQKIEGDNERINMWRAFFTLWHEEFGNAWVSAGQVYETIRDIDLPVKGDTERKRLQSLGYLLNSQVDAVYTIEGTQYRIEKAKNTATKGNMYRLIHVDLTGTSGTSGTSIHSNARMYARAHVQGGSEVSSEVPEVPEVPVTPTMVIYGNDHDGWYVCEQLADGQLAHTDGIAYATEENARNAALRRKQGE
jgi:hypothetical protein